MTASGTVNGHSALRTRLCDVFGVDYPIVQTAMGWVATPELVAGSANAGAMGFLACAVMRPAEADAAMARVQELTEKPFGVNFLMEQPGAADIVESIVRRKVKAASYSRSPNPELIARLKDAGVVCVPTVGAPRHAEKAVKLGADVIVAQGGEGGGHTGSIPTSLLLPQVLDAVDVPVAAAGGFYDGRGLAAALAYGADGIAMGTRFLLTEESPVPRSTLERYFAAGVTDIFVTTKVDGLPQRVVRNELVTRLEQMTPLGLLATAVRSGLAYRKLTGASVGELLRSAVRMKEGDSLTRAQTLMAANAPILIQRAMVEGHPGEGVLPSGQVAGVIKDLPTCAELVRRIVVEAGERLSSLAK